jgi:hypothetical protein
MHADPTIVCHQPVCDLGGLLPLTSAVRQHEIARHRRWVRRHPAHSSHVDQAHRRMQDAHVAVERAIRELITAQRALHHLRVHDRAEGSQP